MMLYDSTEKTVQSPVLGADLNAQHAAGDGG